jgi:ABC-type oligopeptide transport system ATPase subunit
VSLALCPGRYTILVGESGSEKTIVARVLAKLYSSTAGENRFRGQPIGPMLDISIRLDVLNLLLRQKEEDAWRCCISPMILPARYFADETLVMYDGQMVEGGPSEAVTQTPTPLYSTLATSGTNP